MSNYKLTFKLKQHTPIIHFQHDQHEATLRASELKPKLDKFLIEKLGGEEKLKKEHPDWFINKEKPALDYKVRVSGNIENKRVIYEGIQNQYGFFFGTIGDEYKKNPKGLTFTENEIDLIITSFKDGLLEIIEANIVVLFEQNNFGTRQSKGFGSFTVIKQIKNQKVIDISFSNSGFKTFFTLEFNNREWFAEYKNVSEKMNLLYKALRSGINLKNGDSSDKFYFKSLMFLYAKEKYNSQWEKKTIKEQFFPKSKILTREGRELYFKNRLDEQKENRPDSEPLHFSAKNKKIFKDLLGLSSEESWFSYSSKINKVQAKRKGKSWVEEEKEKIVFDRFKSPIMFKPILVGKNKLAIYIYLNQESLDEAIKTNKDFIIKNNRDKFHLSFPDSFSLDAFFNFFLDKNNFDISTHVEDRFHKEQEYEDLTMIFNSLRSNKS